MPTTRTELLNELAALRIQCRSLQKKNSELERNVSDLSKNFSKSLDMMCIADMDGYFKRANLAWTSRLGWSTDELLAKPFLAFVHPDDCERTIDKLHTLNEGVTTIMFENRYRHRDGSYRWLQWNAQPEPNTNLIYATARDITRQRELEDEIVIIADREREHLGQEFHDGLGQTLAGIAAISMSLARSIPPDTQASIMAAEINLLLRHAIRDTRGLARGLSPVRLVEDGLVGALKVLASSVQNIYRITCRVDCVKPHVRFEPMVEKQLYRIAQEAVNNSTKHGHAEHITITLENVDSQGHLCISDDGVGLRGSEASGDGMGLRTMTYRARLINGTLQVQTPPSGGSTVSCRFPLVLSDLAVKESEA